MDRTLLDDLSRIKYEIERFLLDGSFDLYEDERLISSIEPSQCATEFSYGKLILFCWGDAWSRSWRIVRLEILPDALHLVCAKQIGRVECEIWFRRQTISNHAAESRSKFTRRIAAIIESNFNGTRVERAITSRDDRYHFSSAHTRLLIKDGKGAVAGLAVGSRESQANIDATLGAGILWLDHLQYKLGPVNRLMIFVPDKKAGTIATRLTAIDGARAEISLFEFKQSNGKLAPVAAFDQGDLSDRLTREAMRARWPRQPQFAPKVEALVDRVFGLAPELIESRLKGSSLVFSIRGLDFARLSPNRKYIEFGLGENKAKLDESNQSQLDDLVSEIAAHRTGESGSRNELMYRLQAEAWLESIIRCDVAQLDPALDSRFAYSQVPAYRSEQRGYIDLLTATRSGRLVIIELKVSEDAESPFQGLDYWLRVEWHQRRGDFNRRGYFKGLSITGQPPLLYLVAPLFRFHATTKLKASWIIERVPVYRIGINEDWRNGVRVLVSERLNQR